MIDIATRRRFFAEEIEACCGLRSAALIEALATIPREAFLPPGPWTVRGENDLGAGPRQTPDSAASRVYHNVSIAIDAERQLFNGGPGVVAPAIESLGLASGYRVLHVGAGLGYYTAVMAHIVGPSGRVVAFEADESLARRAAANLASMPWATVRAGGADEWLTQQVDAILVSAGVTHPLDVWLDALVDDGRMVLPLTASLPHVAHLTKGVLLHMTKDATGFSVRPVMPVVIYGAIGIRDAVIDQAIGEAFLRAPFFPAKRYRRDVHDADASCCLHTTRGCFSRHSSDASS